MLAALKHPENPTDFTNLERRVPDIYQNSPEELQAAPSPRILKSHEPFTPHYPRVIYLVRDPRDVVVSYHRYQLKQRQISPDLDLSEYVRRFTQGQIDSLGRWDHHVLGWFEARKTAHANGTFLSVRYEDLQTQTAQVLRRMAAFLSIPCSSVEIERAISLSSAERMRALEERQGREWRPLKNAREDVPFIGPARIGHGSETLDAASRALIEDKFAPAIRKLGYA